MHCTEIPVQAFNVGLIEVKERDSTCFMGESTMRDVDTPDVLAVTPYNTIDYILVKCISSLIRGDVFIYILFSCCTGFF